MILIPLPIASKEKRKAKVKKQKAKYIFKLLFCLLLFNFGLSKSAFDDDIYQTFRHDDDFHNLFTARIFPNFRVRQCQRLQIFL